MLTRTFYTELESFGRHQHLRAPRGGSQVTQRENFKICLHCNKKGTKFEIHTYTVSRDKKGSVFMRPYFSFTVIPHKKRYLIETSPGKTIYFDSYEEVIKRFWPGKKLIAILMLQKIQDVLKAEDRPTPFFDL